MSRLEYVGGNVVTVEIDGVYERGYMTMMEFRAMVESVECQYKEQSCCPSCGTLTLDGSTCVDCRRYEESKCEDAPIGDESLYVSLDELYNSIARDLDASLADALSEEEN